MNLSKILLGALVSFAAGCAAVEEVELGAGCTLFDCGFSANTVVRVPNREQVSGQSENQQVADFSIDPSSVFDGHTHDWVREILTPVYEKLVQSFDATPQYPIEVYLRPAGPTLEYVGDKYRIGLNVRDNYYMQYVYQFAHELAHALTGPHDNSRFDWFEETLAQLASLYMIESFAAAPPWNGMFSEDQWREYLADVQQSFIDDRWNVYRIDRTELVSQWFPRLSQRMESDCCIRELNGGIAFELLPYFVGRPELWQSVAYINSWDSSQNSSFEDYLNSWTAILARNNQDVDAALLVEKSLYGE